MSQSAPITHSTQGSSLADILERVLDKGVVIAGDIKISLADVELLDIKIRLLIASVDKAKEMGIDWWQSDPALSSRAAGLQQENLQLRERLERLEARLAPVPA
ncbi:MAG: gas vesicle protein [Anaerolineae bacterium]